MFTCTLCKKSFKAEAHLKHHNMKKHKPHPTTIFTLRAFVLCLCDTLLANQKRFKIHMKKKHPEQDPQKFRKDYELTKKEIEEEINNGINLEFNRKRLEMLIKQENGLVHVRNACQKNEKIHKLQKRQIVTDHDKILTGLATRQPKNDTIVDIDNVPIKSTDLQKLVDHNGQPNRQWLGDEAVNTFIYLVWEKVMREQLTNTRNVVFKTKILNSQFSARILNEHEKGGIHVTYRAFRDKNIANSLDYDLILSPIAEDFHWTLLAFRPRQKDVTRYNSIDMTDQDNSTKLTDKDTKKTFAEKFITFLRYVEQIERHEPTDWTPHENEHFGGQTDGFNCGVFVCAAAERLLLDLPLTDIQADDMTNYRTRIARDILNKTYTEMKIKNPQ